jgi:hypothetical protein
MTLREAVEHSKCRKGKAVGTTKRGAYWLAGDIKIRSCGGDGVGQNAPDVKWWLELRYYRSGEVRPTLMRQAWHQNGEYGGSGDIYFGRPALCDCTTIEEVVVNLKTGVEEWGTCYGDDWYSDVRDALVALGMTEASPSPDDSPSV